MQVIGFYDTYVADIDSIGSRQHDLWSIWHDMDGSLVLFPGFFVLRLKEIVIVKQMVNQKCKDKEVQSDERTALIWSALVFARTTEGRSTMLVNLRSLAGWR